MITTVTRDIRPEKRPVALDLFFQTLLEQHSTAEAD